jgi:hypothetical protein
MVSLFNYNPDEAFENFKGPIHALVRFPGQCKPGH